MSTTKVGADTIWGFWKTPGVTGTTPGNAATVLNVGPAGAGSPQNVGLDKVAPDEDDDVKINQAWPDKDHAKIKEVARRMLKLLDQELSKPAFKQRVIKGMTSGKLSPSGGVDPYSEIAAERIATLEEWWDLEKKVLRADWVVKQPDIDWDTAGAVEHVVEDALKARFDRKRSELEKTVPRVELPQDRRDRLYYERAKIDREISRLQNEVHEKEKALDEKNKLLAILMNTDGRTPDDMNEPPHPPWGKIYLLKQEIENLKIDIKVSRDIAEKDLPKKAAEVDAELKNEKS